MQQDNRRNSIKNIFKNLFSTKKPIIDVNGVYFGENRFLRVVNQPSGRPEFVSEISGVATNFQLASRYGNIGLIAHNFLGGKYFSSLNVGDTLYVMNGYRQRQPYRVSRIHRYQALNPHSPRSDFIDLETNLYYNVNEVFKRVYTGSHHLILQTCIEKGNMKEWGRLFIIALPVLLELNQFTPSDEI